MKSINELEDEIIQLKVPIILNIENILKKADLQPYPLQQQYAHKLIAASEVYINKNDEPEQIRIYELSLLDILGNSSYGIAFSRKTALSSSQLHEIISGTGMHNIELAANLFSNLRKEESLVNRLSKYDSELHQYLVMEEFRQRLLQPRSIELRLEHLFNLATIQGEKNGQDI